MRQKTDENGRFFDMKKLNFEEIWGSKFDMKKVKTSPFFEVSGPKMGCFECLGGLGSLKVENNHPLSDFEAKKRTKGHFWSRFSMKAGPKFGLKMVRKDSKMIQMDWKLLKLYLGYTLEGIWSKIFTF